MNFDIKGKIWIDKKGTELLKEKSTMVLFNKHIKNRDEGIKKGDIVVIHDKKSGELLGTGIYERVGNLGVRILTFGNRIFSKDLVIRRLKNAKLVREKLGFKDSYRWINSASDRFSGLIIDKYNDIVVIQSSSIGMDNLLEMIANIIREIDDKVIAVYVRNDLRNRKTYNLDIWKGFIGPRDDEKEKTGITEGDAKFLVDVKNGNKTGFYLDQRINRLELSKYAIPGSKVLDCFAYTGGFGIHALLSGSTVTFIENNATHIKNLKENIDLNQISEEYRIFNSDFWEFIRGDDNKYDIIILDPPSFISSRNEIKLGTQKYYKMNLLALKKLKKNGILISSSCSYFMDTNTLQTIILSAAEELSIELTRMGRVRGASPCHLIDPKVPGLEYLKCYFFIRTD
ncbi:MAG: methyltransferase [Candidatus Lokiarchaeota archaeon]|nr:methyltransferase [Candidatus Lokiarchaeota archaeon]